MNPKEYYEGFGRIVQDKHSIYYIQLGDVAKESKRNQKFIERYLGQLIRIHCVERNLRGIKKLLWKIV